MSNEPQPEGGNLAEAAASTTHVRSGLAVIGLEAGAEEIAIIEAVDAIYGPNVQALMAEGFDGIPHEPGADMSKPPRTAGER